MSHSLDDRFQQLRDEILKAVQAGRALSRQDLIRKHPDLAERLNELFAEIEVTPRVNDSDPATQLPVTDAAANIPDELATLPPASASDARYAATAFRPAEFAATGVYRNGPTTEPDVTPVSTSPAATRVHYFGDYELMSEIARGGMGVVYKARHVNLNRIVALKMILSGHLASDEDIRRFHTEAESAAHLDHPGIVPIYEIGEHNGQHYFSMGFVDGKSLADRVKDGPLPPREAASLTRKISEAIAYAHEKGMIHRDLKPANVLLDAGGEPKVTDFGLARKLEQDSGLTRTGAVMGTPSYMPPEQAAGETGKVGPLADVYSLGAILYCLLTGRPPFQASNPLDTLLQVMEREPIAPRQLNPTIPKDLETICLKCLQKDRLKRYETANDLAADLGRWERGEPIRVRAVTRTQRVYRWIKRNRIVSALLAATTVGLMLATGFGIQARTSEVTALASQEQTEATLARSNLFLAQARWDDNRVGDAFDLLKTVPEKHRKFEWYLARLQFDQSQFSYWGHTSEVSSVSFSPDGTRIASGSGDNTIKIWEASTGKEINTLKGHTSSVTCVSFSVDGMRIASGSRDSTIKIWEAATSTEITTLKGHTDGVTSVSFSPDGTRIASGSADNTIKIWEAATSTEINTLKGHTDGVTSVSFSPDGMRIASGSSDNMIKIWEAATSTEITTLKGHEREVSSVSFSPDGMRIASGSSDNTIKIWEAATSTEITTLKGHEREVSSVSFSPDGTRIASGSADNTIKIWDASSGTEITTLKGHTSSVTCVSFSLDGMRIASGSRDSTIKIWEAATSTEITTLKGHNDGVTSVSFSPDGTRIASGSYDNTIKIWDASTGTKITTLKGHTSWVTSVSFSPDGTRIASGSGDNTIKIWDASTGMEITTLKGHTDGVTSVSFSPEDMRIASGSWDNTIKIWDASTGTEITTLKGHTSSVSSVSFSPDGTRIASGSYDNTINIWDASTGTEITTLKGHTSSVSSVSFSPDGTRIASGSGDTTINIWDATRGTEITTLKGHTGEVTSVSFNPDGTRIASGSSDNTIKIWDASTGTEITTLEGHTSWVTSVSFSADGARLFSRALQGEQLFWDVSTGNVLAEGSILEFLHSGDGNRSPDGRWFTVRHENVLLVDLTYKNTPREKLRREALARPKPQWHREQLQLAQSAGNLYPCVFHAAWLLKINPVDGWAYDDLHEAHRKLLATNNEQTPPLPAIVSEMLQQPRGTELPQLTVESAQILNYEFWNLVQTPVTGESAPVSSWHSQRIQDICSRYPQSLFLKTLGVLQYRMNQFDAAIETLRKSFETSAGETGSSMSDPAALAFLALCHHQLGQTEPATQFRQQLTETVQQETWVLNPQLQAILVEVQSVFDGQDSVRADGTVDDFNREAGFEKLSQHRWRFWPNANSSFHFEVSATNPHSGTTCLSIFGSTVMANQSVTVLPQSRYRLTGWIRTQDVVSDGSVPNPADGVSVGMLPVDVSAEWTSENGSVPCVGTTDWTQVTFEFQTGDASTMQIGCRSRNCRGNAWFDDLHLEKLE